MIAIFATETAAQAYCAEVDAALGYPRAGVPEQSYPTGWTLTWSVPCPNPTMPLWAVEVPGGVEAPAGSVERLDASWSPVTP